MPARFYYAEKSEGLDPNVIISSMKGAQSFETFASSDTLTKSIYIANRVFERKPVLEHGHYVERDVLKEERPDMALFMMGTTDQLTKALLVASKAGYASFYLPEGSVMHIRYVRRKAGPGTKSVVGIAPLKEYWGLEDKTKDAAKVDGFPWIPMYTGGMGSQPSYDKQAGASITLSKLVTQVVPRGKGQPAAY